MPSPVSVGLMLILFCLILINIEPRYKGILDIKDLNRGCDYQNNAVGLITGKFNVDGRGFDVNTLT